MARFYRRVGGARLARRVGVALSIAAMSAAAASVAAATTRSSTYTAFNGGLEVFYPQGAHGNELSAAWNSSCWLVAATGPFNVKNGHFNFRSVESGYGFAGKGTINKQRADGEVRAWSPGCNTGWVHFVAHKNQRASQQH